MDNIPERIDRQQVFKRVRKPKPTLKEVSTRAKDLVMKLFILSRHYSFEIQLDELKKISPDDAFFLERTLSNLYIREKLLKQYIR